jgi:undecaprenyl-diphosphatase
MSWRIIKKTSLIFLSVIGITVLIIASHLGYNFFSGNVHTVIPGEIYRTAQLDKSGLQKYTKQLDVKTIVNLRGVWKNDSWYQVESQFAKKNNLHYYPMQFSAYNLPSKQELRDLVELLETAPKPLMFHCEGGADRTGMAGAISIILFDKNPSIAQIKRQASWHYNAISSRTVGYQVMRNYFAWLKANHYRHSTKQRFLAWLDLPVEMKPYHGWFVV